MIFCLIAGRFCSLLHIRASAQSANTTLMPALMDIKKYILKSKNMSSSRQRNPICSHVLISCWRHFYCETHKGRQYKCNASGGWDGMIFYTRRRWSARLSEWTFNLNLILISNERNVLLSRFPSFLFTPTGEWFMKSVKFNSVDHNY